MAKDISFNSHFSDPSFEPPQSKIDASLIEGKVVENLRLLQSLLRTEKIQFNQFKETDSSSSQKNTSSTRLKNKIVDQISLLDLKNLAQFSIPKKYQKVCFDLLSSAWRKKIYEKYSQILHLVDLSFSKESLKALVIALSLNVDLKALRIERCSISLAQTKLLAVFIKVHPSLNVFYLNNNPVGDQGIEPIFEALNFNDSITHLSLEQLKLTDHIIDPLEELLKKKKYQEIYLRGNEFSKKIERELIEISLKQNIRLHLD